MSPSKSIFIRLEAVTVEADDCDPTTAIATIGYQLVATRQRERVTLTFTLTPS